MQEVKKDWPKRIRNKVEKDEEVGKDSDDERQQVSSKLPAAAEVTQTPPLQLHGQAEKGQIAEDGIGLRSSSCIHRGQGGGTQVTHGLPA